MNGETGGKPFTILWEIKQRKEKKTHTDTQIQHHSAFRTALHSYALISKLNKCGGGGALGKNYNINVTLGICQSFCAYFMFWICSFVFSFLLSV